MGTDVPVKVINAVKAIAGGKVSRFHPRDSRSLGGPFLALAFAISISILGEGQRPCGERYY
ncbi:MAG: hypothetical protein M3R59_05245 [Verrucomicrobiota bacterium]|nr:hypothetical protein [Verrucomicrobiota bacterium]